MSTFEKREKAEEARFKHDQEFQFKAGARRNKLLGLWVAEQLGLDPGEADAYAMQVVQADFERPGDSDVVEKVMNDLKAKGLDVGEQRVRKEMERLLETAKQQVAAG